MTSKSSKQTSPHLVFLPTTKAECCGDVFTAVVWTLHVAARCLKISIVKNDNKKRKIIQTNLHELCVTKLKTPDKANKPTLTYFQGEEIMSMLYLISQRCPKKDEMLSKIIHFCQQMLSYNYFDNPLSYILSDYANISLTSSSHMWTFAAFLFYTIVTLIFMEFAVFFW